MTGPDAARRFREAMGCFASGLTVVTGMDGVEPVGFTCQSFTSVSLDPPLVSFCVMDTSRSWPRLRGAAGLCIHVLSEAQQDMAARFAAREGDRWQGVDRLAGENGAPLIAGALLAVECRLHAEHAAGDHRLVLCRVTRLVSGPVPEDRPLLFYRGRYRRLAA